MYRGFSRFYSAAFGKGLVACQNVISPQNYSTQLKSRIGFKWWTDDHSRWSFLHLARVLHIRNVSAYSGKWNCHRCCHYTPQNHGRWLCIYWSSFVRLSGQFKIYRPKITFFFCSGFSFHVWGVTTHKDIWTGKRPRIHPCFFWHLIIIVTFCCLPALPRVVPV